MQFHEVQHILSKKVVGIAGCGGLGSNAAVALARVGIGKLILADFDSVESSNLNRQYFFLDQIGTPKVTALRSTIARISPSSAVEAHIALLDPEKIVSLYRSCDLLIEAFDKAEMKEMIIETALLRLPGLPLISGVGMAGWGRNERIRIKQTGKLFIVGDGVSEADEEHPPLAPRVGVVSNMMANTALDILLGTEKE